MARNVNKRRAAAPRQKPASGADGGGRFGNGNGGDDDVIDIGLEATQPTRNSAQRMMLRVLEDALSTWNHGLDAVTAAKQRKNDASLRRLFYETQRWIDSEKTDHLFAFEVICAVLQLDSDFIRAGLARKRKKTLTARVKAEAEAKKRRDDGDHGSGAPDAPALR